MTNLNVKNVNEVEVTEDKLKEDLIVFINQLSGGSLRVVEQLLKPFKEKMVKETTNHSSI